MCSTGPIGPGPGPESPALRPWVELYAPMVYSSACRRTGCAHRAAQATRAVFFILARRWRKLGKRAVPAGWLFQATAEACRLLTKRSALQDWWRWRKRRPARLLPPEAPLWIRIAPGLDHAIDQLPSAQRDALLLSVFLNQDPVSVAGSLRLSERRAGKHVARALKNLARRLARQGAAADTQTLAQTCAAQACATPLPEELLAEILAAIDDTPGRPPPLPLARQLLNWLAWKRWRRRLAISIPVLALMLAFAAGAAFKASERSGHSWLISTFLELLVKHEARSVPGLSQPAGPWPASASSPRLDAAAVESATDIYQSTNIWLGHLKFKREQWRALQPKRIPALPRFLQPDGSVLLRNPEAPRNGLAGVLGFDFNWARADLDFGGLSFTNVAVRVKGNGTFLTSLRGDKHPLKVDLNKFVKGQKLGGTDGLAFNNLIEDFSFLSDATAYEFYRKAGVPAPRTAYAYLSLSVEKEFASKPLGLYLMLEPVDKDFAFDRFGSRRAPLFKPVTYELFKHLGESWPAYAGIYDLKTQATEQQLRRVIDLARLVTFATDAQFAAALGEFLDLEEFARYLACEVLLSNYDGFLSDGQNFYLYLDPRSNKFGFIPWDLDLSWGGFFLLGTTRDRQQASIWHPWVGEHRFLQRVLAVDEFKKLYRAQLEDLLARLFVPGRLRPRIDSLAQVLRSPVAAESAFRLRKFDQAISDKPLSPAPGQNNHGANRLPHQLKLFIDARALSVRQQLDGKSQGVIIQRSKRK